MKATGNPSTLNRKAGCYLLRFDYDSAAVFDLDSEILAKVVCNLRNYHQQDEDATVALIREVLLPKAWDRWSEEAIRETWQMVGRFTPSLGIEDELAQAKIREALIEDMVVDLVAWTAPGGRTNRDEFQAVFEAWYPDFEISKREFGFAVNNVTGLKTVPSNSARYWYGFHIPTPVELTMRSREAA